MWISFTCVIAFVIVVSVFLMRSSNWSEAEGVIQFYSSQERSSINSNQGLGEGENRYYYDVDVRYSYVVNGIDYEGDRIFSGLPNTYSNQSLLQDFSNKYQVSTRVLVYYNPKDPSQSCLIVMGKSTVAKVIFFGFIFFVLILLGAGLFVVTKYVF